MTWSELVEFLRSDAWKVDRAWRDRRKRRKALARGSDWAWARWLLTLLAISASAGIAVIDSKYAWTIYLTNIGFGVALTIYFTHVLLRRIQFTLLEWTFLFLVLGNLAGLVLTTPVLPEGERHLAGLAAICMGLVLYGAIAGKCQGEILGIRSTWGTLLMLVLGWLSVSSPGLLLAGFLLIKFRETMLVSPNMLAWAIPLLVLGSLGLAVDAYLTWRCWRAAKAILGEGPLRDEAPPAGHVDRPGGMKVYG